MAFRTIQVGDDLSGKKIYCNFPDFPSWFIGSYDDNILIQTTNGGIMHYQTGATHMEESVWLEDNDGAYINMYEMWDYDVWTNVPYVTCPDDFGTVTFIKSSSGIYPLLTISTGEIDGTLYFGTQKINKIYYGEENILKIRPGGFGIETFTIGSNSFNFPEGQTWRQWVQEQKYWTPADNFGIDQWNQVYYHGEATVSYGPPTWASVDPDDKIQAIEYDAAAACLDGNTLIKTINENIPISKLKIGDILSQNNKIENIVRHIREFYYNIILSNGDIIKASNDHKFILLNGAIVVTNKLNVNDKLTQDLSIEKIELVNNSLDMYEIKTTNNTYELYNGITCECENIGEKGE